VAEPLPQPVPPSPGPPTRADIAVIGAGAAGLFAAIWAARTLRQRGLGPHQARVVALDGAKRLGAKILVAGGGRCNVTHHRVDESAYSGSSLNAIKKVLRSFDVPRTVEFFEQLGVTLKREETGKLFPTSDDAHTVLNALLHAAAEAGATLEHPFRVDRVEPASGGFTITEAPRADQLPPRVLNAQAVILATGGMALPKTGSDGHGYAIARSLGHSITPVVIPALVPLIVNPAHTFITELSGLTLPATIELLSGTGKRLASFTNSTLLTHFGLSGPSVLDISRHWTTARRTDPGARLVANFTPGRTFEQVDALLGDPGDTPRLSIARRLTDLVPERLAKALCLSVGLDPATPLSQLKRDDRRTLAHQITRCPLPVTGDRGYTFAEVTAGGIPLAEIHLDRMASRLRDGLFLCGEICDVDGRIGGFNFQWAWASGYLAGRAAAAFLAPEPSPAGSVSAPGPSMDQPPAQIG
jgi:predicted Rossmann fold flavoprotein